MSQPPLSFPKSPLGAAHRNSAATSDDAASQGAVRAGLNAQSATRAAGLTGQSSFGATRASGLTGQSLPGAGATRAAGLAGQTAAGTGATARTAARPAGQSPFGATRASGLTGQSPLGAGATRTAGLAGQAGSGLARAGSAVSPRPGTTTPAAPSTLRTPASSFRSAAAAPSSGNPFRKEMQITNEEFLHLRDFIYEQCGIFIAENRKYLVENRLSNRIKELNLKSFNEYYKFLRYDANRQKELPHLFEVITTNETSFFRNPPQLEVFQNIVLPEVLDRQRKSGSKRLRIWSAGCSTGEEPYTLAIIISEVLKGELSSWDVAINAYDLSEAVLAAARRGVYNAYSLRTTPPEIVARYFTQDGNQYTVKPEMKKLVRFNPINLNDKEQCKKVEKSQIVFCRNVIIYFDDAMKRRVINAFYDNLEPQGVLLIGHSETLHNISRAFQLEHHTGTIVYRKAN